MSEKITKFIEEIKTLTILELRDLVKAIEEEFGVSAAPVAVAAGPAAGGPAAGPAEEQTEFSVVLKDAGAQKIKVIKVVREITSLGLKEAKEVTENVPNTIKEGLSKEEATAIVEKFKEAGATVEIK
ncbi:MAG TPA: 50S ribosomal protein L7/L12 [Clostridiaceae bacterium]|nr:50S ribosomal protein L7/L12 [Clostridiaceae bacterium]